MAELTAPMVTSAVRAAKPPSSAALGSGLPIWRSATSVAGTVSRRSGRNRAASDAEPELVEGPRGVHQQVAVRAEAGEEVDLVDQGRVDDDHAVRCHHRLAGPDLALAEPAVGDDRGTHPLGAEARERLRVPALLEGGQRQQVGRGHGALPAPAVEAHFEHRSSVPAALRVQ